MTFLAQVIGCIAISIWVISIQYKSRETVLKLQAIANFIYAIEYFLLGAFSAFSMNLVSTIRCFMFSSGEKSFKKWTILFILFILILGFVTYDGVLSFIPIVITCFYTVSSSVKNVFMNRITVLISAFVWVYYNYKVGAYITIVGNIFEIISGFVSIYRFNYEKTGKIM